MYTWLTQFARLYPPPRPFNPGKQEHGVIRRILLIILESLLIPDKGIARTNYTRHVISFRQFLTAGSNSFLTHFTHNAFFLFLFPSYDLCLYFFKHFTPNVFFYFLILLVVCDCYLLVDIFFPKSTFFLLFRWYGMFD